MSIGPKLRGLVGGAIVVVASVLAAKFIRTALVMAANIYAAGSPSHLPWLTRTLLAGMHFPFSEYLLVGSLFGGVALFRKTTRRTEEPFPWGRCCLLLCELLCLVVLILVLPFLRWCWNNWFLYGNIQGRA